MRIVGRVKSALVEYSTVPPIWSYSRCVPTPEDEPLAKCPAISTARCCWPFGVATVATDWIEAGKSTTPWSCGSIDDESSATRLNAAWKSPGTLCEARLVTRMPCAIVPGSVTSNDVSGSIGRRFVTCVPRPFGSFAE